ncbi:MAG: GNAT family N-acetyltransferase [Candidatus Improbicoccus pseudotrichonymphae]|uniref:GNAT family N-acetyltransferase n=1 Tax=Candidatus Improbicoccus pseudotrichonymphae TaxID=3033792 RepID=A0AA48I2V7_9FIRM|nr:MAG: GNAT family N-acetyltransferase [Candidatus Improbicoccus pseudotrichonymphae]
MFKHAGTKEIITSRLILRKFSISDTSNVFKNWSSDPENLKFMSWKAHSNLVETESYLCRIVPKYIKDSYYHWAIVLKSNAEEAIGSISVELFFSFNNCMEIGYTLSKKHWNQGIMTESLKAVQDFLFENTDCHRIQARHAVENKASGRVMVKTGMKFEGILREFDRTSKGEWMDAALYSMLKKDV